MAKSKRKSGEQPAALKFTSANAAFAVAGMVSMSVGYWLLAQGSITAAPLLLVLAYLVLLPMAIIK